LRKTLHILLKPPTEAEIREFAAEWNETVARGAAQMKERAAELKAVVKRMKRDAQKSTNWK
jgi:hypothetical protein